MTADIVDTDEYPPGRCPTAEETFYISLGSDLVKRHLPFLNDTLQKLVTINVTLLGGSLVFLREDVAAAWGRWGAASCFFLSLGLSFWGMLPFPGGYRLEFPAEIKADVNRGIRWKDQMVRYAALALLLGLVLAAAGAVAHGLSPKPIPQP